MRPEDVVVGARGNLRDELRTAMGPWLARHDPNGRPIIATPVRGLAPLPHRCFLIVTDQRLLVAGEKLLSDSDVEPHVAVFKGHLLGVDLVGDDGRTLGVSTQGSTVEVELDPAYLADVLRAAAPLVYDGEADQASWPKEQSSDATGEVRTPVKMPPVVISALDRLDGLEPLPGTTRRAFGYLGGSFGFEPGDAAAVVSTEAGLAVSNGRSLVNVAWSDVFELEVGGPGRTVSGAGVIGGGFGLDGAITGMAIAAGLSWLTRREDVTTLLTATTAAGELHLYTSEREPFELHVELSAARDRIRQHRTTRAGGVAAELARLAELHGAGHLTADEFSRAKAAVLDPPT